MPVSVLSDIFIIFFLSIAVVLLFHRLKLPPIVGFLATGILAGPHGLGLVSALHQVEIFAEIGVVLLLFTIGLEFSFRELLQIKRVTFWGGFLQITLTTGIVLFILWLFGLRLPQGILIGFMVAMSSSAVVLKLIQDKGEFYTPHGQASIGLLIFQDLMVVPMMLLIPFISGGSYGGGESLWGFLVKVLTVGFFTYTGARWIVPFLLNQIVRTGSKELFLLCVVGICFSVAMLTASLGLSIALGAFIAGLIISESEFSQQALGNILPFKDIFMSFFFVSIGMLFDPGVISREPVLITVTALSVFLIKTVVIVAVVSFLGFPLRTAILVGFALGQVGEFSFVLAGVGISEGLLNPEQYQLFLGSALLTLTATPILIDLAPRAVTYVSHAPFGGKLLSGLSNDERAEETKSGQLLIIGFGVNGKNVARAAGLANIPYTIIEINPEIVSAARKKEEPIFYGDATREEVLKHAGIKSAKVVVVAITDASATRGITEVARRLAPTAYILVRTRYVKETDQLYKLGASEVIPEEFETSIQIFSRVLAKFDVAGEVIQNYMNQIRQEGYELFRSFESLPYAIPELKMFSPEIEIANLRVVATSPACGKKLLDLALPKNYGVTVLAIDREGRTIVSPAGEETIKPGDVLLAIGRIENLKEAERVFKAG